MRKFRIFKCVKCEHEDNKLVHDDVKTVECSECKSESNVTLSAPKYFGNGAGGRSPSAVN